MTFAAVEKIADAVLFEGYILYPYRPSSIKNQQRWNFGTLFPRHFAQAQSPEEAWSFHAEMLLEATPQCTIDLRIRFLQLVPPASGDSHNWAEGFVRIRTVEALSLNELRDGTDRLLDLTYLSTEEKSNAPASFDNPAECRTPPSLHTRTSPHPRQRWRFRLAPRPAAIPCHRRFGLPQSGCVSRSGRRNWRPPHHALFPNHPL